MMLSARGTNPIFIVVNNIFKVFSLSISRFTWMHTLEFVLLLSTSLALSCCFPRVKSGITNVASRAAKSSLTKNPRSVKIRSP